MIELKGITWNHTRGLLPMLATAQRWEETHAEVSVRWEKRSLQAFADAPLAELAARFDLMVIDHPSIGEAATQGLLLPLDDLMPAGFLAEQRQNSVGGSYASYQYNGCQWALAIDAATPVAGWRPDLMQRYGYALPRTWSDLLQLAERGAVAVPGLAIDSLMAFLMFANALGARPFASLAAVVAAEHTAAAVEALRMVRELLQRAAPGTLQRNPIRTWQLLAESETVAYCPFAYGYSNYSRDGYAAHPLQAGGLITLDDGTPLRSTLGGAGLAISAQCRHPELAASYAAYVASALCQRTLYMASGGQPGHRAAWTDAEANRVTRNFFQQTLPTLDAAWVRPRWPGYLAWQDAASTLIHQYLSEGGAPQDVLAGMEKALTTAQKGHRA
ncbi:MAG: extracellular solute-binding protein [Acidobacteriota bacterium]|nr:extracellular solute-binding protein [Acidobacteriota bacterium]